MYAQFYSRQSRRRGQTDGTHKAGDSRRAVVQCNTRQMYRDESLAEAEWRGFLTFGSAVGRNSVRRAADRRALLLSSSFMANSS